MLEVGKILEVRTGSHCHGTALPESDEDIRGVFIPEIDYFFGTRKIEQIEDKVNDKVYYEIRKFLNLCIKGNMSALNFLFTHKKDIFFTNVYGNRLLEFKQNFISGRVIDCIMGYCKSQIHRMQRGSGRCGNREALITKYGFDTKFSYHAVMITNIGIELLKTGTYHALRSDGEQKILKGIRTGHYKYEEVMRMIQENLTVIKTLEPLSTLPKTPNIELINEFSTNLLKDYFKNRG